MNDKMAWNAFEIVKMTTGLIIKQLLQKDSQGFSLKFAFV
jgi:hypothetical protein